jgi:hypothetical protein
MMQIPTLPCLGCGESTWLTVTEEEFARIQAGEHIQRVLPHFSAEDRELLISGTCPDCWEEMYAEDEDEEWEDDDFGYDPLNEDYQDWYVD